VGSAYQLKTIGRRNIVGRLQTIRTGACIRPPAVGDVKGDGKMASPPASTISSVMEGLFQAVMDPPHVPLPPPPQLTLHAEEAEEL
jgi:hypothetical protein